MSSQDVPPPPPPSGRDLSAIVRMSRGRFIVTQMNAMLATMASVLITVVVLVKVKVDSIDEFLNGTCGIGALLLRNLTGIALNADETCQGLEEKIRGLQ